MIDVPQNLSKEQQSAVDQLSKTFGDDPRAGLFAKNGAAAGDTAKQAADDAS